MLYLIALGLFIMIVILPMKHGFGITIASSFLFIVPNGIDVTTYFYLFLLAKLLFFKVHTHQIVKYDPFLLIFTCMFIFAIPSYIFFEGAAGMEYIRRFFMTSVIIFIFVNLFKTINDLKIFINYLFAGVLLLSIHIYTQTLIPINPFAEAEFTTKELRLLPSGMAGQYVNSNSMGALMVWGFGTVVGFYTLFYSKYFEKYSFSKMFWTIILGIVLLANTVVILGMLGSRSNFLILFILAIILLFRLNLKALILRSIVFVFPMILLISSILANPAVILKNLTPNNPLASLTIRFMNAESEQKEKDTHSRGYLAKTGIRIFLDNPIFGVGVGNEAKKMREYGGVGLVSHNTYTGVMVEMGLIGIIFILTIMGIWLPHIQNGFVLSMVIMIGVYAIVHNIMMVTMPWLLMSFYYKSIKVSQRTKVSV